MKKMMISALVSLIGSAALAGGLPYSPNMTCQQAADLVKANGVVMIQTSETNFAGYVADQRYCGLGEVIKPAWIPTKDSAACFVGYTCAADTHH